MLELHQVSKEIDGKKIVDQVSFELHKGEAIGLIGPNGAGKSTLVNLISAYDQPTGGEILFGGKNVQDWRVKKLAQKVAVLTQDGLSPYPITVFDAVLMGRYPHLGFFEREGKKDFDLVEEILEFTSLSHLKDKLLDTLSGGERQRVAIAKAMVQQPELLILDEPTTYLDIGHQINILELVKKWQKNDDLTVLTIMHDLNLSAQFCDRLILMSEGKIVKTGTSEEIITPAILEDVYHTYPEVIRHPKTNIPQILLSYEP